MQDPLSSGRHLTGLFKWTLTGHKTRNIVEAEEAIITADDMPVEEEPKASRQPEAETKAGSDKANEDSEEGQEDAAVHDVIIRHDMLIQRGDLQQYLESSAFEGRKKSLRVLRGQGIVFAAGGRNHIANMFIAIRVLRDVLHSKLPIQIVFNGDEELDRKNQEYLEKRFKGVTCINAQEVPYPEHHRTSERKGFALKAFALAYATTFRKVLLLDADNMPLVDPGPLFLDPAFRDAGNLFWPDYWYNAWIDESIYSMFGFPVPWDGNGLHHTTESGQLLFDRAAQPDVLEWLWFLNSHANYVYPRTGGDKDTYKLAFYLAGRPEDFHQVEHWPRDIMRSVSNNVSLAPDFDTRLTCLG
ncbi:hypothetical protein WJX84_008284 [Apatococcus fuscideae]|uniref:Alpha-1,2-mannosyltransferase n=1 Tax=Apatococcus fuscideae TaxID=2026836 RepID=A0AAW1RIJ5_9CHLO